MTIEQLRERLHARHGRTAGSGDDLAFTEAARGVLALALRLAQKLGADEIEATHLMLGYAKAHKKRAPSSQSLLDAHYWDLRSALGYSTVVPERKDDGGTAPLDRAWTYLAVLQLAEQSRRVMVRVLLQGDMDLSPKASDIAKQVRVLAGNLGRRLKL